MVKLNKIYTRTGDDGSTGLVGGTRTKKHATRVSSYGEVDELNAHLGLCSTLAETSGRKILFEKLKAIQNDLFDLGAELATPKGSEWPTMAKASEKMTEQLEGWIDELNASLPELTSFVLPGGTILNAHLHIARTVCRRAERTVWALSEEEEISPEIAQYLNRLSDLLFVMSRYELTIAHVGEYLWVPGGAK